MFLSKFAITSLLKEKLQHGKASLRLKGHFRSGIDGNPQTNSRWFDSNIGFGVIPHLSENLAYQIQKALETDQALRSFIQLEVSPKIVCFDCNQKLNLETNGLVWRAKNKCPFPKGLPPVEFELNVPSGILVVCHNLKPLFPICGEYNENTPYGVYQTSNRYAKAGLAHLNVSKYCGGVYALGKDRFIIGIPGNKGQNPVKHSRLASSFFNNTWVSIADGGGVFSRGGDFLEGEVDFVQCQPGTYSFRHFQGVKTQLPLHLPAMHVPAGGQITTVIYRTGPVKNAYDYAAAYNDLSLSAGQVVQDALTNFPELYQKDLENNILSKPDQLARVVNRILCVHCDGFHHNGFWCNNPDLTNDAQSCQIPRFRKQYNWYPLSRDCNLYKAAFENQKLNDSFASLAINTAMCITQFGVHGNPGWPCDAERCATSVQLASECLSALQNKYPHLSNLTKVKT